MIREQTLTIKVLLIDADNHRKAKIKQVLEPCVDIRVVGSHAKTEKALKFIHKRQPQVLLLDLNIEVKIIDTITQKFGPSVKIIGLARETDFSTGAFQKCELK